MFATYRDYLNSDAWKEKRRQRLMRSNYRCACCGESKGIDVHHLTYARKYDERMEDLLPLCRAHHTVAHRLQDAGLLPKSGDTLFLQAETIRLVLEEQMKERAVKQAQKKDRGGARNSTQEMLMADPDFVLAVRSHTKTKDFMRWFKRAGYGRSNTMCSNANALFQRKALWLNRVPQQKSFKQDLSEPRREKKKPDHGFNHAGFPPPVKKWDSRSQAKRYADIYGM